MTLDAAARAAAGLGPLILGRARARARSYHGSHARRIAGPGNEFWQYRELQPGEAADRVDWRRSGRSDHIYVREREREDPARLWLWVDGSASMDFASMDRHPTKLDRARLLAAALWLAALAGGERVSDLAQPDRHGGRVAALASLGSDAELPGTAFGAGDAIILLGDFLDGVPRAWVEATAATGAVGALIAIADRIEEEFPFRGRTRFEPIEVGEQAREFARAENVRVDYLAAWSRHQSAIAEIGTVAGWMSLTHRTDTDPAAALEAVAGWLRG